MASLKCPDEVLHFPNHMSIEISYGNALSYSKCKIYDPKIMSQGFVWHQIVVQHNTTMGLGIEGRNEILKSLYEAIEGEEFYPVAYRRGRLEDRFLVRQCQPALDKLFAQNLRIFTSNGEPIQIQVQFNVAEFKYGQISPINQITKALNKLYDRMESIDGEEGILNLTRFDQNSELFDVIVNLGNRSVLGRIFDLIYRNDERFRSINGIVLRDNGITAMSPFKLFSGVEFSVLDLRDNNIQSYIQLNRDLENIKADELKLLGNPVTKSANYPECLRPILKNFKMLDGIPTENLSKDYRPPTSGAMEGKSRGYKIEWSNKADVNKFEKSNHWHAFMIPDPEETYTKEEIMDYFFLTVTTTCSDIYPCYYKYANGEHQFMVRQCFDQIKYLVENCNLEIKVPRFVAPPPPTQSTTDFSPQLVMDTTLIYYLLMDISPFKKGQVEPMECIEKALNRRFSAMDRMLNLNNFQATEGLENIIINLSSPKILSRVLMQASRKFLSTCIEIRLTHNKILSANFPKILALMGNLKALDLGNNWIHSLDDVKELAVLGITSLRLDGNPLCNDFAFSGEYIKAVKNIFTDLTKLDGIAITAKDNLSSPKNFLCDVAGYDFVEEFITRYCKAFENDRYGLKELYSDKSILSINCSFNLDKMTPQIMKRISKYSQRSRNLKTMKEPSETRFFTYVGSKEIMRVIMDLPPITYDMLSLCTDCTMFQDNMVVITVNGVYLDQALSIVETDILMAFTRTFILKPIKRKMGSLKCATLYRIVNDQYCIYNPTSTQTKIAFKYFKNMEGAKKDDLTIADKEALLVMFQETTLLKSIWCTRCLEEANWDFAKALEIFIQLCEKKEIPDAALR
ncbi:nuclear RNA export factor 2 [Stomoxys calcitrans]|uniref:nuclear RNA export factor 2 n=1 Tax=Stomoxys calcitrans TaxID=35570 RepID=UPI0027E2EC4D|nr:nuclear RNA export factor 2 [Stomoxys calcitrans]